MKWQLGLSLLTAVVAVPAPALAGLNVLDHQRWVELSPADEQDHNDVLRLATSDMGAVNWELAPQGDDASISHASVVSPTGVYLSGVLSIQSGSPGYVSFGSGLDVQFQIDSPTAFAFEAGYFSQQSDLTSTPVMLSSLSEIGGEMIESFAAIPVGATQVNREGSLLPGKYRFSTRLTDRTGIADGQSFNGVYRAVLSFESVVVPLPAPIMGASILLLGVVGYAFRKNVK